MSEENTAAEVVQEEVSAESQESNQEIQEEQVEAQSESSEDSGSIEVSADTEEELQQELQDAADNGASDEELTDMVRQFTLKVNNKEYVRELDLNDHDAVKNELQKALAGQLAMQEKAEMQKAFEYDKQRLMDDPFSVLEELGLDPIDLSAKQIEKYIQQKSKTPEQLEDERIRKEYEEMRAENERLKQEREESERSAQISAAEKEIETDIIGALEGDPDLESSPEVVNMVVDNMLWAMQNGFPDVKAKDVIPTVKKELQNKYRSYAKSMKSTAALKSLLGDDILNNLREERIEKVQQQVKSINSIKPTSKKNDKPESDSKKKISLSDFMNGR